jgi:uncharacterized protein (TIGR03083 family)
MVGDEREEILGFLGSLTPAQWDTPSLCEGWRVRDVAVHLLVDEPFREIGWPRGLAKLAGMGFSVHRANAWWVAHNATRDTADIMAMWRRSLRLGPVARLLGASTGLRAGVIHHQDMRRPLGMPRVIPAKRLTGVLDAIITPRGSGISLPGTGGRATPAGHRYRLGPRRRPRCGRPRRSADHGPGRPGCGTRRPARRRSSDSRSAYPHARGHDPPRPHADEGRNLITMSEASKKLLRRQVEDIFSATHPGAREELIAPEYVENGVATFGRSSPSRVPGRRPCARPPSSSSASSPT